MFALQKYDALSTHAQVFEAYRAVLPKKVFLTYMVLVHRQLVAAVATITVIGAFSASHFANATFVAVVDSFLLAHVVI